MIKVKGKLSFRGDKIKKFQFCAFPAAKTDFEIDFSGSGFVCMLCVVVFDVIEGSHMTYELNYQKRAL